MKLSEALLNIRRASSRAGEPLRVGLACGFTPLHLQTLLTAHLGERQARRVEVESGLYGDLVGNLSRAGGERAGGVVAFVEWPDVDLRLSLRQAATWSPSAIDDMLRSASLRLTGIEEAARARAAICPVVVCLPTLPLPPADYHVPGVAGALTARLGALVHESADRLAAARGVRVLNPQTLDGASPPALRHDVSADLTSGFPYTMAHADALAQQAAALLAPRPPLKGVITDLDDTLWKGTLGEEGVAGITWDVDHGGRIHGLYQQVLQSLAEAGILVGVATKNDSGLVEEALRREDLLVAPDRLFPVVAGWGPKSESVRRILADWNIKADDVVFIDNSAAELGEVALAHPGLRTVLFPAETPAIYALLLQLREWFGKEALTEEDRLRSDSLRAAHQLRGAWETGGVAAEQFLRQAEAELTLTLAKGPDDPRALELVNKTNQFNLNGRRYSETEWAQALQQPGAFLAILSYRDKYGPLGKICVALGQKQGTSVRLEAWVMSCRAFSRRIEHACLKELFGRLAAAEMVFDLRTTEKNSVIKKFIEGLPCEDGTPPRLTRTRFETWCPALYHSVRNTDDT